MRESVLIKRILFLPLLIFILSGDQANAAEPIKLSIESPQIEGARVEVTLVIQNSGSEPLYPHNIINDSQIIINDRSYPVYLGWMGAKETVISPGESFSKSLDLTFYQPFDPTVSYTLRWMHDDFSSAPLTLQMNRGESKSAAVSVPSPAPENYAGTQRELSKVYYESGELFSETDLFSDVNNGFYRTYHRNGALKSEVRYKNGWQVYDKAFDENGAPITRNGPVRNYYGGGNVLSDIVTYRNDRKHGKGTYYYYDGKTVVDTWNYFDGVQAGIHTRYDQDGKLKYQEDWGYPTAYVEQLKRNIYILCALVGLLLAGLVIRPLIGYFSGAR